MASRDEGSSQTDLPEKAEVLLSNWPLVERAETAWQALAERIEAKVQATQIGATDASVLCAPLPVQAEERPFLFAEVRTASAQTVPSEGAEGRESACSSPSAKASAPPAPFSKAGHGERAITRARLELEAEGVVEESAEAESDGELEFDDATTANFPGNAQTPPAPHPSEFGRAKGPFPNLTPWFGGALMGIAATAIFFVVFRPIGSGQPAFVVVPAQLATQTVTPDGASTAAPKPAKVEPTIVPATSLETEEALELREKSAALDAEGRGRPVRGAQAGQASGKGGANQALPMNATADAVILEEDARGEGAMAQGKAGRAGSADADPAVPGLEPAAGTRTLPDRPSIGAAQAALGSVLSGARSCIAGQEPSRATVVFRADGTVERVLVTGPAVGTAAEGCIQAALGGARVEPFARTSFSVAATVRPH